jgi:MoaA/NifB/PqqE/SkfB family radical SAM enzyme
MASKNKVSSTTLSGVFNSIDPMMTRIFLPWALRHPRYLRGGFRLIRGFRKASRSRKEALAEGVRVPPFLIISVTPYCNLRCAGCFAAAVGTTRPGRQLGFEQWHTIIKEACELGVYSFIIAGGEPFLYPGLMDLCGSFKDRFFLILTNGTVLTEEHFKRLKRSSNVAVIVSIEGGQDVTDGRRGKGVHEKAIATLERLSRIGAVHGISVTITRDNHGFWMDDRNLDRFISQGVRIGVFLEYIPTSPGPEDHLLMLDKDERARFREAMLSYRENKSIYIIHSPGDEEFFGGCVSAGRGFAHITPAGDLTPCPVSNIATHNLTTSSLREALASPLFTSICENEHLLEVDGVPCALLSHPEEVEALAKEVGAYRTDIVP